MNTQHTRLQKLEARTQTKQTPKPYLTVADESKITGAMHRLKVYVGISPDDWDDEHTHPIAAS